MLHDHRGRILWCMKHIGLMGVKQSGKSTVANILAGFGYAILEPGQQVMELLIDVNPFMHTVGPYYARVSDVYDEEGYEGFKSYPEGRRLLQELGTRIRERNPNFWVHQQARVITQSDRPVVSTAVRFPNEAAMIRELGGEVWHVVNPRVPDNDDQHASEQAWRTIMPNRIIPNVGTMSELESTIRDIFDVGGELR